MQVESPDAQQKAIARAVEKLTEAAEHARKALESSGDAENRGFALHDTIESMAEAEVSAAYALGGGPGVGSWIAAIAIWIVVGLIAVYFANRLAEFLNKLLGKSKSGRAWFAIVAALIEMGVIALLVEAVDFSEVFRGTGDRPSLYFFGLLGPAVILTLLTQYVLVIHGDSWEQTLQNLTADLAASEKKGRALEEMSWFWRLLAESHQLAWNTSAARLREKRLQLTRAGGPLPPRQAARLLLPEQEQGRIVSYCANVLREEYRRSGAAGEPFSLRAALWELQGDSFVPRRCSNGTKESSVLTVPLDCPDVRLPLNDPNRNLIETACRGTKPLICPDAQRAAESRLHNFRFLDEQQRERIKSIAAIPICLEGESQLARYVLCIDASKAGYISEAMLGRFELLSTDFAERLSYAHELADTLSVVG